MRPSAPSAASATMEMALVQTILGPGWNRRFNCADDADDTDAKEPNPSGLWIRDCVYRACYCLPTSGNGIRNRPAVSQARTALLPGCREITAQAKDKPMLHGDSSGWPTRFFGLAKEHANKPRVVAAVDAESDIDVESSVPVVKSRTVSDSLRECGASHVSSSEKIPCRPQTWGIFSDCRLTRRGSDCIQGIAPE